MIEVRHASWERREDVGAGSRAQALGWCVVDQPASAVRRRGPLPRVTGRLAYLRLHGRNSADWFRPDAGRDARYDYLYPPARAADELAGAARRDGRRAPRSCS